MGVKPARYCSVYILYKMHLFAIYAFLLCHARRCGMSTNRSLSPQGENLIIFFLSPFLRIIIMLCIKVKQTMRKQKKRFGIFNGRGKRLLIIPGKFERLALLLFRSRNKSQITLAGLETK